MSVLSGVLRNLYGRYSAGGSESSIKKKGEGKVEE
jgi:hypothetical protein